MKTYVCAHTHMHMPKCIDDTHQYAYRPTNVIANALQHGRSNPWHGIKLHMATGHGRVRSCRLAAGPPQDYAEAGVGAESVDWGLWRGHVQGCEGHMTTNK